MPSKAKTVAEYLAELPEDRRAAVEALRKVFRANLDKDIHEGMTYGMIGYFIPHSVFPAGYHCDPKKPLPYAGIASQKGHMSLHLMSTYICKEPGAPTGEHAEWLKEEWAKSGKKLDMGAACIRFKKLEDLPLDVIAEAIRRVPSKAYIAAYVKNLESSKSAKSKPAKAATTKAPAAKKPTAAKKAAPKKPAKKK